jgi:hypothetical protein
MTHLCTGVEAGRRPLGSALDGLEARMPAKLADR